jgi:signal transduction histidine kinase
MSAVPAGWRALVVGGYDRSATKVDELDLTFQNIQSFLNWSPDEAARIRAAATILEPCLARLIDDFLEELGRHPGTRQVLHEGAEQVQRMRQALRVWLGELLSGTYDEAYARRRRQVGLRHVEIGLDPLYTNVAMGRMRTGLCRLLIDRWTGTPELLRETVLSLNKLLDLDLALIQHAYQTEDRTRQQAVERLATLGQVADGVAHELRNPLNVIKTSVYYMLRARQVPPEKLEEHLRRIERQVEQADAVITTLSNAARLPAPKLEPIHLEAVMRRALETHADDPRVTVALDCPDALPWAIADPDQLGIVLGNLIRNACEAMPEGGSLELAARFQGERIALEVRDAGTGIAPEDLSRIMEPLYSTKARGLGLGLAIAQSMLEKNHGRLTVASELGRGSTFTIWLRALLGEEGTPPERGDSPGLDHG